VPAPWHQRGRSSISPGEPRNEGRSAISSRGSLADVDCELTVGTDLDEGPLTTAGLDRDDDGVGHAALGYRPGSGAA
jgi:hypothetical protein